MFSFVRKKDFSIGGAGERKAARFLKDKGYAIVERNYRNSIGRQIGEIDIIARDKKGIVFVEVKSQKNEGSSQVLPAELNITPEKLRKLERIALYYLKERAMEGELYRFEAIRVVFEGDLGKTKIHHITDMFL